MIPSSHAKPKSIDSLSTSEREAALKSVASLFEGDKLSRSQVFSDMKTYARKFGGDQADELLVRGLRNFAEMYVGEKLHLYTTDQLAVARNELGNVIDGENLGVRFAATLKTFEKTLNRMVDSKLAEYGIPPVSEKAR